MAGSWAGQGQAKGHGAQGEGWRGEVAWGWLEKELTARDWGIPCVTTVQIASTTTCCIINAPPGLPLVVVLADGGQLALRSGPPCAGAARSISSHHQRPLRCLWPLLGLASNRHAGEGPIQLRANSPDQLLGQPGCCAPSLQEQDKEVGHLRSERSW